MRVLMTVLAIAALLVAVFLILFIINYVLLTRLEELRHAALAGPS